MTLSKWLRQATAALAEAGIESPALESQVLAAHAFQVDRTQVLVHGEWPVPEALETLLQRRLAREPLAYLTGQREFFGHRFAVGPGVLIPRQETETLVEAALALELPAHARVLDVGTGSGCIAISLAHARPSWAVSALDISLVAVAYARRNATNLGVSIDVLEGDALDGALASVRFDLIVSNPPYVGDDDYLPPEVRHHEPPQALFAGEDGLDFYRRLATHGLAWLEPRGWMLLEVGDTQANAVERLLAEAGWQVHPATCDLSGIARVVRAQGP
ncbi:MAG: peptide chain release factor N(5)-glutamine methyltransferase [Methanoregulaceae archaeon]|nr:peptide chain release factor N(5)-glutamine methyltransferase [Methanoregulaceae archaeon]